MARKARDFKRELLKGLIQITFSNANVNIDYVFVKESNSRIQIFPGLNPEFLKLRINSLYGNE